MWCRGFFNEIYSRESKTFDVSYFVLCVSRGRAKLFFFFFNSSFLTYSFEVKQMRLVKKSHSSALYSGIKIKSREYVLPAFFNKKFISLLYARG